MGSVSDAKSLLGEEKVKMGLKISEFGKVVFVNDIGDHPRVCELLLALLMLKEESERLAGMTGEIAPRGRDLRGAEAMNEGHDEIAQGRHHLGSVA